MKLRLFRHNVDDVDDEIRRALLAELVGDKVEATALNYATGVSIYRLVGLRPEHVDRLALFMGTQSLGVFPDYPVVRPAAHPISKLTSAQLPAPEPGSGALRGDMTATLVCGPPLDATFGAEYCRSNLDVSLGTYLESSSGNREHKRQVEPFPTYPRSGTYEKELVEQGFKWSPVKVYRRSMPKGVSGDIWRLALMATDRSGAENATIPVALAVTISDPDKKAPVYNEVVAAMNQLGWISSDVVLRPRSRARG